MATKKRTKQSGGGRIAEQGKSLIWVTVTDAEKQVLRTAAGYKGLPMSQFLKQIGLREAEKILARLAKNSGKIAS